MKNWIFAIFLIVIGSSTFYLDRSIKSVGKAPETKEFKEPSYKADLADKSVLIPVTGQFWAFGADQKIEFTFLEKKQMGDVTLVYGSIKTTVDVPPEPEGMKEVPGSTPGGKGVPPKQKQQKPVSVTLDGIIKLSYENVNERWYLTSVDPIDLKVSQK